MGPRIMQIKNQSSVYPLVSSDMFTCVYPPKGDTQYLTRGPVDTLSIYWD